MIKICPKDERCAKTTQLIQLKRTFKKKTSNKLFDRPLNYDDDHLS